jgi:ribosomal peptide maturation radical SAM protein 1
MPDVPDRLRVALVEMPFGPIAWPAIGPSLLAAQLQHAGHGASVHYFNMLMLGELGPPTEKTVEAYHSIADSFDVHAGEWVFTRAAFPNADLDASDAAYLARLTADNDYYRTLVTRARPLRAAVPRVLDAAVRLLDQVRPDVVGFGMSFSQTNAATALARRLRAARPDLPIIAGGCACSDVMGEALLRITDVFDAVALGEADEVIVELVEALARGDRRAVAALPGVAYRADDGSVEANRDKVRVRDVNALPYPAYDDYYRDRPAELAGLLPFYIPVEASRGCWWGAKSHCTFCGLNPTRMAFYRKEPERFLREIEHLRERHDPPRFMAVDNIMPHEYHRTVLPHLHQASGGAEFFFEVKANFRREQMERFAAANVRQIQPGVESLSSRVLRIMKKGTTAIANVYTLRLVQEMHLRAHWSILYGFGGETLRDYTLMAQLAARVLHLPPPMGAFPVEVERFAPMFRDPEGHGLTRLRPSAWYPHCFPVREQDLEDLAYRFDADYLDRSPALTTDIRALMEPLVAEWRDRYDRGVDRLEARERDGTVEIVRSSGDVVTVYRLDARAAELCREFERPRHVVAVLPDLADPGDYEPYADPGFLARAAAARDAVNCTVQVDTRSEEDAYDRLLLLGILVQESGMAVSVACGTPPAPPESPTVAATTYLSLATT